MYQIIPDMRPSGPRFGYEEWEDFATPYNAAPATATVFNCNLPWRAVFSGTAAAVTAVNTGLDNLTQGELQLATGTQATGAAAITRNTGTGALTRVYGAGQYFYHEWGINLPALSTVAQEYIVRVGPGVTASALGTDVIQFEYDRLTSVNWRGIARAASGAVVAASGGTDVAVAANVKLRLGMLWDSAFAHFFVADTFIGRIAAASVPTLPMGDLAQIIASAGTTTKLVRLDWMYNRFQYTTPRA